MLRTIAVFGSIFAAGYVARRYFGWDTDKLLDQAKDKLGSFQSKTKTSHPPSRGAGERAAI